MDRWEMEKKIVMKALKDPTYKKKLLSSPKEAMKELFKNEKGVDLSKLDKLNIRIHEEKQGELIIALPHIKEGNRQLSDAELENLSAAGGVAYSCSPGC